MAVEHRQPADTLRRRGCCGPAGGASGLNPGGGDEIVAAPEDREVVAEASVILIESFTSVCELLIAAGTRLDVGAYRDRRYRIILETDRRGAGVVSDSPDRAWLGEVAVHEERYFIRPMQAFPEASRLDFAEEIES
jgi:hypothetical protein